MKQLKLVIDQNCNGYYKNSYIIVSTFCQIKCYIDLAIKMIAETISLLARVLVYPVISDQLLLHIVYLLQRLKSYFVQLLVICSTHQTLNSIIPYTSMV